MSDFTIPKGRDYVFKVKILEKESFLAKDLTTMTDLTVDFMLKSTSCSLDQTATPITYVVLNALNGEVQISVPSELTATMVSEQGDKVDGYYLKPTYKCVITAKFSDDTDVLAIIDKVYVVPLGC